MFAAPDSISYQFGIPGSLSRSRLLSWLAPPGLRTLALVLTPSRTLSALLSPARRTSYPTLFSFMKLPFFRHRILAGSAIALLAGAGQSLSAATIYTWTATTNNNWNNTANWLAVGSGGNGAPPGTNNVGAADIILDLTTIDLTAARAFNLNNGTTNLSRTAGTIKFGDASGSGQTWNVAANNASGPVSLTLAVTSGLGTIDVNNVTANINVCLLYTSDAADE